MRTQTIQLKDHKQRGEWAELCFMARAAEEGFRVWKPYGDSACYDVGIEYKRRFLRVQVKSTLQPRRGAAYRLGLIGPEGRPYKRGEIDFLAAYLISADRWYIVPSSHLRAGRVRLRNMQITPGSRRGRWHPYEEAWELLRKARIR